MRVQSYIFTFVLCLILHGIDSLPNISAYEQQKRMDGGHDPPQYQSFSNDINACLFGAWVTADVPVLNHQVACNNVNQQLCYGAHNGGQALFAVCYNTGTLIPEFTGNIVQPGGTKGEEGMITPTEDATENWRTDHGLVQAGIRVALVEDYDPYEQANKFLNYNPGSHFLARGHLSPNGDFSHEFHANTFTFITTNCAPQWQPFNSGNWAVVERAVLSYATNAAPRVRGGPKGTTLYVFTGTGGRAKFNNDDILLNNRVVTPRYFWKAVCDPFRKRQSIVFVAENNPGDVSETKVSGCGKQQTQKRGIVHCYSLQAAMADPNFVDFQLPPFSDPNCRPAFQGNFLTPYLNGLG